MTVNYPSEVITSIADVDKTADLSDRKIRLKKNVWRRRTTDFAACLLTLGKQHYLILSKHPKYIFQIMLFNYNAVFQSLDFDVKLL